MAGQAGHATKSIVSSVGTDADTLVLLMRALTPPIVAAVRDAISSEVGLLEDCLLQLERLEARAGMAKAELLRANMQIARCLCERIRAGLVEINHAGLLQLYNASHERSEERLASKGRVSIAGRSTDHNGSASQ